MFSLSRESENSLKRGILKLIQDFLQSYFKPKPRLLNIKYGTVKRWEEAGLKRYMPPIEGTRTVFYKIDDVLLFLGVEN